MTSSARYTRGVKNFKRFISRNFKLRTKISKRALNNADRTNNNSCRHQFIHSFTQECIRRPFKTLMTSRPRDICGVKNFKWLILFFWSYVLKVRALYNFDRTNQNCCKLQWLMSLVYPEVKNLKRFIFKFLSYVLKFQKSTLNIADGT